MRGHSLGLPVPRLTAPLAPLAPAPQLHKVVAIKSVDAANLDSSKRDDLIMEIRVMQRLDPHPHIVDLIDFASKGSTVFIAMEYCDGGASTATLTSTLHCETRQSVNAVVGALQSVPHRMPSLTRGVQHALRASHRRSVAHGCLRFDAVPDPGHQAISPSCSDARAASPNRLRAATSTSL